MQHRQRPPRPGLPPDAAPWRSDVVGRSNSDVDVSAFESTSPSPAAAAAVGEGVRCRCRSTASLWFSPPPRPVAPFTGGSHNGSLAGRTDSTRVGGRLTASTISSTSSGARSSTDDDDDPVGSRWGSGDGVQSGSAMRMRRLEMVEYCRM